MLIILLVIPFGIITQVACSNPIPTHTFNLTVSIPGRENHVFTGELYSTESPMAVENFRALCTGEKGISSNGHRLSYIGTKITRIVAGALIEMGDITAGNGRESIYGGTFDDTDYLLMTQPGSLIMSREGNDSNGSEFGIVMSTFPEFDGIYQVFGAVKGGLMGLYKFNMIPTENDIPKQDIIIQACEVSAIEGISK